MIVGVFGLLGDRAIPQMFNFPKPSSGINRGGGNGKDKGTETKAQAEVSVEEQVEAKTANNEQVEAKAVNPVSAPKTITVETPEEMHASNLRVIERFAQRHTDVMHEGVLHYGNYLSEPGQSKREMYALIDKLYRNMPEGYGYQIRPVPASNGGTTYAAGRKYIQLGKVSSYRRYDYAKKEYRRARGFSGFAGAGYVHIPEELLGDQAAIRGYAKIQVFIAAGKIWDTKTKEVSKKYPALDYYGKPKKEN